MLTMSTLPVAALPWQTYRDVRLRALATDPDAFGSNLAREQAFDDARWIEQAANPGTFLWFAADPAMPRQEEAAAVPAGLQPKPPQRQSPLQRTSTAAPGSAADSAVTFPCADGLIGLIPATMSPDATAALTLATYGAAPERLAFVTQMWVTPERRGAGAFDGLMDAALARAHATGVEVVALSVYRDNERAAAAYRRRGFTPITPSPGCPADEDEYVLRLR